MSPNYPPDDQRIPLPSMPSEPTKVVPVQLPPPPTVTVSIPITEVPKKADGKLSLRTLCLLGALLPGVGCYMTIAYSYVFQFERVMNFSADHCPDVHSPLPPVSYSIGVWQPQKFFWLFVLIIHIPPRLFIGIIYKRQFSFGISESKKEKWYKMIMMIYMRLIFLEVAGLILVSVVDIHSHFFIHAIGYTIWLTCFNFNMLFNCILQHYSGIRTLTPRLENTFQIKRLVLIIAAPLSISTGFTYISYANFCIGWAYVAFSLAEYILVGFNSLFYFLLIYEVPTSHMEFYLSHVHYMRNEV